MVEKTLTGKKRIDDIDFLKFVFIVLMITFHLVYIGDKYPDVKRWVYTFHMPGFLLISGFLFNIGKSKKDQLIFIKNIFVPYAVMECGYTFMASLLPIREHIDSLTLGIVAEKVFFHPLGPYWYLQTLMICSITAYLVYRYLHIKNLSRFIIIGGCFYILSDVVHIMSFACSCYFLSGLIIRQCGIDFLKFFQPTAFSIIPIVFISANSLNFDKASLGGIALVYFIISLCLWVYKQLKRVNVVRLPLFIGRNTLILLLFSPIFTVLSKVFLPFMSFDNTGICFILVAVSFSVFGSFIIALVMDKLKLSRLFFGKEKVIQ